MYHSTYRNTLNNAWDLFIQGRVNEISGIRSEIIQSWQRCRDNMLDPMEIHKAVLDAHETKTVLEANRLMIDTAIPLMDKLYALVKDSGFIVLLSDKNGTILHIIGDDDVVELAANNLLVVGANRSEESIGTNAIGTPLILDKPIQIWGEEHYYVPHRTWTCSGAPIHDEKGHLIGCIDMSGPRDKAHSHTLGMVVAAASAIEKQIAMHDAFQNISIINSQLQAAIESMTYGVIIVDEHDQITKINGHAYKMLSMHQDLKQSMHIHEIFETDKQITEVIRKRGFINDQEFIAQNLPNNPSFSVSISPIKPTPDTHRGMVVTIKESKYVRQLVNKISGSQAQFTYKNIIGQSQSVKEAIKYAKIASQSSSNVLLLGESGTGKELFAQSIHNGSSRANGPFIAINCGALPRSLIESELFGYESGAFTGAKKNGKIGKFELANGGTIFLDEIGDMPLDIQVNLLRVIQNREVVRIGSNKPIKIDVRIIAATHHDLEASVQTKDFRSDLFYRLNVFTINIPPLRARENDVLVLANYFLRKYSSTLNKFIEGLTPEVETAMAHYRWPGNIRELENAIERAVNVSEHSLIQLEDLPMALLETQPPRVTTVKPHFAQESPTEVEATQKTKRTIKEFEKEAILKALNEHDGNIRKTAETLGIGRRTLYRKLTDYEIDYNQYRK